MSIAEIAFYDTNKRSASTNFTAPTTPIDPTDSGLTFLWRFDKAETTTGKQFYLKFDEAVGGCITRWGTSQASPNGWWNDDATPGQGSDITNLASTALFEMQYDDGTEYKDSDDASAELMVMEDSPSRVRIRARANLVDSKYAWTEYTIYPDGKIYIKHQFKNDSNAVTNQDLRLATNHLGTDLTIYAQDGITDGTNDFFVGVRSSGLLQDWAWILHEDYFDNDVIDNVGDPKGAYWEKNGTFSVGANSTVEWYTMVDIIGTYTGESDADSISADFRAPAATSGNLDLTDAGDPDGDGFREREGSYTVTCRTRGGDDENVADVAVDGSSTTKHTPSFVFHELFAKENGTDHIRFHSRCGSAAEHATPHIGDGTNATQTGLSYVQHERYNGSEMDDTDDGAIWWTGEGTPDNVDREIGTAEFRIINNDEDFETTDRNFFFLETQNTGFAEAYLLHSSTALAPFSLLYGSFCASKITSLTLQPLSFASDINSVTANIFSTGTNPLNFSGFDNK